MVVVFNASPDCECVVCTLESAICVLFFLFFCIVKQPLMIP